MQRGGDRQIRKSQRVYTGQKRSRLFCIEYVYFPNSGVASVTAALADGGFVEIATVGREGAGHDQFGLSHKFLAVVLGVRRQSVTVVAGALQTAGLIS